ncbi:hypothetical protein CROQUDRAFT_227426 [Cronartium quercuum f. sp. fusiforme G11]|uniref:Uncharacterized protein n=1 Tax=Cronartium quercuum f. sp. fusiforme G11 TaxID=708437 RepID=A0A9P6T8F8_9BASI|nr:hypothetical protein CROQUDRAFT_227426 [Cronartium quercuum f. sp. fusiforme G11]
MFHFSIHYYHRNSIVHIYTCILYISYFFPPFTTFTSLYHCLLFFSSLFVQIMYSGSLFLFFFIFFYFWHNC